MSGWLLPLALSALGCDDPTEVSRVADQLGAVEAQLGARDVTDLDPLLREERAANLLRLQRYRERGLFPRNTRHAGQCVPYFIDEGGRACAVGQLMIDGGYESLAHEIATDDNHGLVLELDHPLLMEWVARSGLTAIELALVQPCYTWPSCYDVEACRREMMGCETCYWSNDPDGSDCGSNACATHQCLDGTCETTEVVDCDDEDPCTYDKCDAAEGCIHLDMCGETNDSGCAMNPDGGHRTRHVLPVIAGFLLLLRRGRRRG